MWKLYPLVGRMQLSNKKQINNPKSGKTGNRARRPEMKTKTQSFALKFVKVWATVAVMKMAYDMFNKPDAPFWAAVFLSTVQTLILAGMAFGLHTLLSVHQNEDKKER
jgi:hypothetical protein